MIIPTVEENRIKILELCNKHNISAYEIGSNTELNTSGIQRIIRGETKNPHRRTLNIILKYIDDKLLRENIIPEEEVNEIDDDLAYDEKINTMAHQILDLLNRIRIIEGKLRKNKVHVY